MLLLIVVVVVAVVLAIFVFVTAIKPYICSNILGLKSLIKKANLAQPTNFSRNRDDYKYKQSEQGTLDAVRIDKTFLLRYVD